MAVRRVAAVGGASRRTGGGAAAEAEGGGAGQGREGGTAAAMAGALPVGEEAQAELLQVRCGGA